jgi:hypothetical protein
MTPILNTFAKQFNYEQFDARNPEHLKAYMCLAYHARQHPTLRFYLEEPYQSVPSLMSARIAEAYTAQYKGIDKDVVKLVGAVKSKAITSAVVDPM